MGYFQIERRLVVQTSQDLYSACGSPCQAVRLEHMDLTYIQQVTTYTFQMVFLVKMNRYLMVYDQSVPKGPIRAKPNVFLPQVKMWIHY